MTYSEVIDYLIKSGKMTREELVRANLIEDEVKYFASVAHTLFCAKCHNTECNFYDEDILDVAWEQPDHKKWLDWINCLEISHEELKRVFVYILENKDLANNLIKILTSLIHLELAES